jgi:hypothetical protein
LKKKHKAEHKLNRIKEKSDDYFIILNDNPNETHLIKNLIYSVETPEHYFLKIKEIIPHYCPAKGRV